MAEDRTNLIERFREITNATEEEANHWLMEGNFDVEQAVQLSVLLLARRLLVLVALVHHH